MFSSSSYYYICCECYIGLTITTKIVATVNKIIKPVTQYKMVILDINLGLLEGRGFDVVCALDFGFILTDDLEYMWLRD